MSQDSPAIAAAPKKPFYKRPRFWLITFGVLLLLPFALLAGVYFALKSSLLETYIWPKLQPIIAEETGFQVELSQIRIDLLSSIYLKDIQVSQIPDPSNGSSPSSTPSNCDGFNLTLAEVELDFSAFDLLKSHVQINKLALTDLQATGCLLLDLNEEVDDEEVDDEEISEDLDLQALIAEITDLLDNPPISLNLEELALNNFKINLQVKERKQQLSAAWQGEFNLFVAAAWQDNGIVADLNTQLTSLAPFTVEINQTTALQLDLTAQPNFNLQLASEIKKQQGVWHFKLSPADIEFNLVDLQLNIQQEEESLSLNLPNYSLKLNSEVNLAGLQEDQLEVSLKLNQQLNNLKLVMGEDSYQFAQLGLLLNSHNQQDKILADLQLSIQQLDTDFSFQPLDVEQNLQVEFQADLSALQLKAISQVNQLTLAELSLALSNQPQQLNLQPELLLNLPAKLAKIFKEPSLKELPGDLKLEITGNSQVSHSAEDLLDPSLFDNDFEQLTGFLQQSLNLKLSQSSPTTDLKILQPLLVKLQLNSPFPKLQPDIQLSLSSKAIQHPPLLKPVPIDLKLAAQVDASLQAVKAQLELLLNHQQLAKLNLQATDKPQQIHLTSQLDLAIDPSLQTYLADLQPLAELGHLAISQQFELNLKHPEADLITLAASDLDLNQLQAKLIHGLQLTQKPAKNAEIRLDKPFKLEQTFNWRAKELNLKGTYNFAALEIPEVLKAQDLNLSLQLNAKSGLDPEHISWVFNTKAKSLTWLEETPALELSHLLPLNSQGDISYNAKNEELIIRQFSLQLNSWFKQQLSGEVQLANLDKPSLQLEGHTHLEPHDQLIPNLDLTTSGSLSLPWQVMLHEGEQLSLQAQLEFNDFSLAMDDMSFEGLQGTIAINEELRLSPEDKLSFYYLLKPEAFQRVDFNQIEPYLVGNKGFNIAKLQMGDLAVGPLQARFDVKQNLIELPQFSLQLLAGDLAGQFYLDVTPKAWRLGLLSRISQLDLRLLLPKQATSDYAPISARTAIEFDFNQRLLAGRMDITDITRSQLLQLLELVDPEYQDPQINNVRTALRLAHPQWISVVMQNGLMDLTFGLSLFSEPLRAHGLPLSPIIERFGEEALLMPDQLPLE